SILITAYGSSEVEQRAQALTDAYITKPFLLQDVLGEVERILQQAAEPPAGPAAAAAPALPVEGMVEQIEQRRSVHLTVLACDFDGTLAEEGQVDPATWDALRAARMAGMIHILVTGRTLDSIVGSGPFAELFEAIVARLPAATGDAEAPLQALIFDSHYDAYRGTVVYFRVVEGRLRAGELIRFMSNDAVYKVEEVGIFQLRQIPAAELSAGQVGYLTAGIKTISDTRSGDTITHKARPCAAALPGFKEAKPVVFSSIYPVAADDYEELATAIEKLKLNDAAIVYEKDTSVALGFGFRCGFLGLLHLEVVQERLEREYGLTLILTAPSVRYRILMRDGAEITIDNPALYPDPTRIETTLEPFIRATIIVPDRYMGAVMKLCLERRGANTNYQYLTSDRLEMIFELPLAEVIYDFYDRLKSITQGYGSFDYDLLDYRETDLVKLDILINGERVDALSQLVHRDGAVSRARIACEKIKEEIPRQMFKIAVQGAIGGTIIARETVSPLRKDVLAKCSGGHITRTRKLLEKQKKGKKRMKMVGKVMIPQSAFLAVLKTDTD
ncbi:MAG: elongation factor 4, partial [Desulfobacteraceae bacterium]